MKIVFLTFSFIIFCRIGISQDTVKIYMDDNFKPTISDSAKYIRYAIIKADHFFITDKDINDKITNYCEFKSINPWIEDGKAEHYAKPGDLYSTGSYKNGKLIGQWIYYDNKIDTVNYDFNESFYSQESCNKLKKFKIKRPSKETEQVIVDSIKSFFDKNFHLPARTGSITTHINQKIELILDTDKKIKCPILTKVIDYDLEKEILRILYKYESNLTIETPYKIDFNYEHFGLKCDTNNVYIIVEQMPEFAYQGCEKNPFCFNNYIEQQISELNLRCSGIVHVQFIIEPDGRIRTVEFPTGLKDCPGHEEDIRRVFQMSPQWIPGKMKGKPVRVKYMVAAKLESKKK